MSLIPPPWREKLRRTGLRAAEALSQLGKRENRWWALSLLAVLILLGWLQFLVGAQNITLRLDLEASQGDMLEVFVNENNQQPFRQKLVLNQRHVYQFENLPGHIQVLRIDPTNVAQATVKIFSLSICRRGQEVVRLEPAALTKWKTVNLDLHLQSDHVQLNAQTLDPYLYERKNYYLLPLPRILHKLLSQSSDLLLIVFLLGAGVLLVLGGRTAWRVTWVPLALVAVLLALAGQVAAVFLKGSAPFPSGLPAIGNAVYFGYSKVLESRAFWGAFLLAVLLAGLAAYGVRYAAARKSGNQVVIETGKMTSFSYAFFALLLVVLALKFPPIQAHFAGLPHFRHVPHWDGLNVLTWQFLVFRGWLPFKDFWYPYGGFYNMYGPFPWDMFRLYLHNFLVFGGFSLAIYTLLRRDKLWTIFFLMLVWLAYANHLIVVPNRYFISLNLILLFAALQGQARSRRWHYALYGVYLAWSFTRTPPQLIYASLPVGALIALKLWRLPDQAARLDYVKKIGILSAAAAGGFLLYFVALALRGQLPGFFEFYTHLGSPTIYSAIPTNLRGWFQPGFNLDSVLLFSILGTTALGAYLAALSRRRAESEFGDLLLALGLLGALVFQKLLVRPGMGSQMIGYYIVVALLYFNFWSRAWIPRQQKIFLIWVAGLGLLLFMLGAVQPAVRAYAQSVTHLTRNVRVLFEDARVIQKNKIAYFSPASLSNFSGVPEFMGFYRSFRVEQPQGRFYVLGDEAYFYIAAGQQSPYCLTSYNASDIQDQVKIVTWLEANQIERVIWNPKQDRFDNVPHQVRVPLIYHYVIEQYAPHSAFGDFQVLQRRPAGHSFDLAFWEKALGRSVDLGYLPAGSCAPRLDSCAGAGNDCHQFLEVWVEAPEAHQPLTITLQSGDRDFQVSFRQFPHQNRYFIYLNRLWFWDILVREGARPTLAADQVEGVRLNIIEKRAQNKYLY